MKSISSDSIAGLCHELFGIEFEKERLDILVNELNNILGEIEKIRELDLSNIPPVVVFDARATYFCTDI